MSPRVRMAAALAMSALAMGGATATAAHAEPNNGGNKPKGCEAGSGIVADPGDEMVSTVIIHNAKGKVVGKTTETQICGEDGEWHLVKALRAVPQHGKGITITTTNQRLVAR